MAKLIRFPWATSGDRATIPDAVDPSGAVSWTQGFGPDYERDPATDPLAKRVPRAGTNQYLYDLSDNVRQYQLFGVPEWYSAADNGGVAISYPIQSVVRHNDVVYRSIVATNTVEPGTDANKWAVDAAWTAATETAFGVTRYATLAEAAARTANNRAVTPEGLGALYNLLLNNPVFPEVMTSDNLFSLSNPAGNVRVAAGTSWVHRGAFTYTSVSTDLPTVASKTYHLRWAPGAGFTLNDLASGGYNPSSLAEDNPAFDTTYDNMLIARVVTSAGNAATITRLANKARLLDSSTITGTPAYVPGSDQSFALSGTRTLNWSRTPGMCAVVGAMSSATVSGGYLEGAAAYTTKSGITRYSVTGRTLNDWSTSVSLGALNAILYFDSAA